MSSSGCLLPLLALKLFGARDLKQDIALCANILRVFASRTDGEGLVHARSGMLSVKCLQEGFLKNDSVHAQFHKC